MSVKIYGEAERRAVEQIERCQAVEEGARAVLCADNHVGYSQPIGVPWPTVITSVLVRRV